MVKRRVIATPEGAVPAGRGSVSHEISAPQPVRHHAEADGVRAGTSDKVPLTMLQKSGSCLRRNISVFARPAAAMAVGRIGQACAPACFIKSSLI
jgi:hypothetical protein